MSKSKSKNDIAWEKIFEKYRILDRLANNERVSISSMEINEFREARLHKVHTKLPIHLPELLRSP